MSPRKKISPNHPGRRRKKKVYIIIIWEADVLPLHHKRVVENNTPSTFRRELFIDIYIFCRLYASRKSNPRLQLFLFSLPKKKKKKKKKTQSSFNFSLFRV